VDIQVGKEYYLLDFSFRQKSPAAFAKVAIRGYVVNPYRGWTIRVIEIYIDKYDTLSDLQGEAQSFSDKFFYDEERINNLTKMFKKGFIRRCFDEVKIDNN
jgi:hypothetical protein